MVEELVDVVIHVKVPKKYAEEFRKEVEARAWYLAHKKELFENLKKLKGIMKTDKSWKEIKRELYEGLID
ncbi:hypothetical protein, conserved [Thermococcus kodakarensis KOD1]|uniref:Uncharacterized protein n=1 Tax=Thermococcus kodakarensis (strain ATCC BAA-918 / JCM 12380 / KOD1) TaxID=69014 RepID=Q5JHW7_THEKO|nr:hypothetical protein [Thermococcus kodakarensis]WCN27928.1 hypothetical protein POG15_10535 [Thermococcus kodakarensis]WCN30227.1 hypothetical protein POG21_10520 [Thermococcus kodakarensis]BAD86257.1 hypothetical protein, conserved [Thermococcus kodakarensis KOD1]